VARRSLCSAWVSWWHGLGFPIHLPAPQGRRGMLLMSAFDAVDGSSTGT
jgi:hypothetical protein